MMTLRKLALAATLGAALLASSTALAGDVSADRHAVGAPAATAQGAKAPAQDCSCAHKS